MPSANRSADRRFYGRRKGKRLRAGRQALMETLYPTLSIPIVDWPVTGTEIVDPRAFFDGRMQPPRALWLEIGFGGGEHLAHQALTNPDIGFIGAEPFVNGVSALLSTIHENAIPNIRLYGEDVRPFLERLPEGCFEKIFLLFPDPWPKARHWRRRFVNDWTLDLMGRVLVDGGELRVASDDPTYQTWTLRVAPHHRLFRWTAKGPNDWRLRWADACPTRYEQKALRCGRTPLYFTFERRPRDEEKGVYAQPPR